MEGLIHRCHGNFPQRQASLFPQGVRCRARLSLEAISSETNLVTVEEPVPRAENLKIIGSGFCELEDEPNHCWNKERPGHQEHQEHQETPGKQENLPEKSVRTLLKKIRIHPEAQRILGNSSIAVVSLERLNFQSVCVSSLQPVVSLVRLPSQSQDGLRCDVNRRQQSGFSPNEDGISEVPPESEAAESADQNQAETTPTSWTEPYCPENSSLGEPEQDSGFDCESNPDQAYILLDEGSDDGTSDSETFYLDPDPEQAIVIEVDPETDADQDHFLELADESDPSCEADVVQVDHGEEKTPNLCSALEQEPETGAGGDPTESEDFCAVCLNGGDLLCCDRCPKVYHLACHIPRLISFPLGDWVCTLCRSDQEPAEAYDCENTHSCGTVKVPYTLSDLDQRKCEKLSLLLYCHTLSAPFHEPVSPLARNYYQIIKRPIDLSVVRRKLDKSNTLHYFTAEQFVDDVLLMFKNCATFNYPDSEVAQAGRNLEVFFLSKLKEVFPEQTFPLASQDRMNKARLRWLRRRRRHVFSGKKYYL